MEGINQIFVRQCVFNEDLYVSDRQVWETYIDPDEAQQITASDQSTLFATCPAGVRYINKTD